MLWSWKYPLKDLLVVGTIQTTPSGTEIAVFTFNSIYLGPEVDVAVVGQRALGLASRTSIVINTTISAQPGTLGGMQGGGGIGRLYPDDVLSDNPRTLLISDLAQSNKSFEVFSNNANGLGSGSLLVTTFTVRTQAEHIAEIQTIQTSAAAGQTLKGGFKLHYKNFTTPIIPHDASSKLLKSMIEDNLNILQPSKSAALSKLDRMKVSAGVGIVNVSRIPSSDEGGYSWKITFRTAVGNIDELKATSFLQGINAAVNITTITDGNDISGNFTITIGDQTTSMIPYNSTADTLKDHLLNLENITTAMVSRIDPTGNCDDGLCGNGPLPSHGYVWTCLITTNRTDVNISPTSPTSTLAGISSSSLAVSADGSHLSGLNATIFIEMGTSNSPDDLAAALGVNQSFSLSYGGVGGSHGGFGGQGYGGNIQSLPYNDKYLTDLLGGSGGGMRSTNPFEVNRLMHLPHGRGGSGGGAIEMTAANDIIIGAFGKIQMTGGNAGQSAENGAGGGSGGAILLAAGGIILIDGGLTVQGGDGSAGAYGDGSRDGGGGSGGRIALYAQSITLSGYSNIDIKGGKCGRRTIDYELYLFQFQSYITLQTSLTLKQSNWKRIATLFLKQELNLHNVSYLSISSNSYNNITLVNIQLIASIHETNTSILSSNISSNVTTYEHYVVFLLDRQVGQSIAGITFYGHQTIALNYDLHNMTLISYPNSCLRDGNDGTYYSQAEIQSSIYVASTEGAEGTSNALFIRNREYGQTSSGSVREAIYSWNGPTVVFEPGQPSRVTFYIRITSDDSDFATKSNFGALLTLISHSEVGLNVSSVIGVFMGYQIMHGANFGSSVDERVYLKRMVTIADYPTVNRWYKVDIRMKWNTKNGTYSVAIDDTVMVKDKVFTASSIDSIRLSVTRSIDVWFDEIYVGFDNTMEFTCPTTNRSGTQTVQPTQQSWSFKEVHGGNSAGYTEYNKMTRHYNHLSTTGTLPLDGQGMVKDNQDIKLQYADGDYLPSQGKLSAGALLYVTNSSRSGKTPSGRSSTLVSSKGLWNQSPDGKVSRGAGDGRYFYYTEYNYESALTPALSGGICACSSQDLLTWRFEGIVFHYVNITDMVFGSAGPFSIERPVVKYNVETSSYVMWAVMDDSNRSYAQAVIMSSPYEDGPFYFRRSLYPDGNKTRDQVLFYNDGLSSQAVIGRTYYLTVEYVLPQAIMQPVRT